MSVDFTAHVSYHYQVFFIAKCVIRPINCSMIKTVRKYRDFEWRIVKPAQQIKYLQLTNKKVMKDGKVHKETLNGPQEKLEHTLESVGLPMVSIA